jgi:integrase
MEERIAFRKRAQDREWGSGSIIRETLKSGRAVWRVKISIPGEGLIRKRFQDRRDAEAYLGELRKRRRLVQLGERPQRKPETTIPLGQLLFEYLQWAETARRVSTLKTQKGQALTWLDYLGDNTTIGEITKARVLEVLQGIAERTSRSTANRYLALIRRVFNWAVERGYLENNPISGIKPYKENPGRTRWLRHEEAERLLMECEKIPRLYMFTAIALLTGMRLGEIESLRWGDIDLERGTIRIPDSKTGQARIIPLEEPLKRILETWPKTGELVLGKFTHKKAFMGAVKRAGLSDFRFHDLRHTYASWKVMAGVDLRTIAGLLGHRTLAMVMRYSHLAPEHLEKVRGKGIPANWAIIGPHTETRGVIKLDSIRDC